MTCIPKLPWNIYWINLERRPDRREHMMNILRLNEQNSFRVEAIDYKNNFHPYTICKNSRVSDGHHGCTCSHIKAMKLFLETSKDEYCFISEDDLSNIYSSHWLNKHLDILKKGEYDILQLKRQKMSIVMITWTL